MSNESTLLPPEVQCSLTPWKLDVRYIYTVEAYHRGGCMTYLYERYPVWAAEVQSGRGTSRTVTNYHVAFNHLEYIRDVLNTTCWLPKEREKRVRAKWEIRCLARRMLEKKVSEAMSEPKN